MLLKIPRYLKHILQYLVTYYNEAKLPDESTSPKEPSIPRMSSRT